MPAPTLSVVVNNFNYARYLPEALDSVLSQLADGDELLVVDDGSTDESAEILRKYATAQGMGVIHQSNGGQVKAVRNGISAATRDIIVLLDSDDYFLPGYLDRVRGFYASHPDVDVMFASPLLTGPDAGQMREIGNTLERISYPTGSLGPGKWATLLFHEFVGTPTSGFSIRRDLARKILLLPQGLDRVELPGPVTRFLFGIPRHPSGHINASADGILVRCVSVLGAQRYFDRTPGFAYRIHGSNFYASLPRHGQLYVRSRRKAIASRAFRETYKIPQWPSCSELSAEITGRSWPVNRLRRATLRLRYAAYALRARGSLVQKLAALLTALGIGRPRPASRPPP